MNISVKYFIKQYLEPTSKLQYRRLQHDKVEFIPGIQDCFNFEN